MDGFVLRRWVSLLFWNVEDSGNICFFLGFVVLIENEGKKRKFYFLVVYI